MTISATERWHAHRWWALPAVVVVLIVAQFLAVWRRSRDLERSQKIAADKVQKAKSLATTQQWNKWIAEKDNIGHVGPVEERIISRRTPKRVSGRRLASDRRDTLAFSKDGAARPIQPLLLFFSLSGSTEQYAISAGQTLQSKFDADRQDSQPNVLPLQRLDLSEIDYDDYFTALPDQGNHVRYFYIILMPTYNIDSILTTFTEHLIETHHDFRVDTAPLRDMLGYAVFGFGDRHGWPDEAEGFCSQAIEVDKWMAKLTGRKRAYPLGLADVRSDATSRLHAWTGGVHAVIQDLAAGKGLGEGVIGSGNAIESDEEEASDGTEDVSNTQSKQRRRKVPDVDDVESLGATLVSARNSSKVNAIAVDFTTAPTRSSRVLKQEPKPMVPKSSPTYTSLTKQGYSIIGTHSGVKICRWTKSALRGRGSCYKYSFYGIQSHLCMETTPSLSCSNKCVFCWRHGTNPVGTTWRWQVDPPNLIFNGAKEAHYKKIKMMRGVPGVRAERFEEAMRIRHCALSLVGEPIFYPHINAFIGMLHAERISSFLVCNAQHPVQLAALDRVTQLYVSIDASNRESLRRIDRPLHRDFWERFNACLEILAEKRFVQRTVFRLTLVKGFNLDEDAQGYADLVARGLPCFVEVKGVTYCGTATSAGVGLTMQNVPFYEEVSAFVEALNKAISERGLEYGIAAEHAHSCCILLASKRFYVNQKWHTTINYKRFFELLEGGETFSPEDYCSETPDWATWGQGGFDPRDERVDRKGKKIDSDSSRRKGKDSVA